MGMDYEELMHLTPRVFANKARGWAKMQTTNMQADWERSRWMVATTITPHLKKPITPSQLVKFAWEKGPKNPPKSVNFGELLKQAEGLGITL